MLINIKIEIKLKVTLNTCYARGTGIAGRDWPRTAQTASGTVAHTPPASLHISLCHLIISLSLSSSPLLSPLYSLLGILDFHLLLEVIEHRVVFVLHGLHRVRPSLPFCVVSRMVHINSNRQLLILRRQQRLVMFLIPLV